MYGECIVKGSNHVFVNYVIRYMQCDMNNEELCKR